jgi:hypothetical protein
VRGCDDAAGEAEVGSCDDSCDGCDVILLDGVRGSCDDGCDEGCDDVAVM